MPKVSIIVPVYNAEKYIEKCLGSLVNQTLKDIEIIVINDGSKDKSLNIIEEFAKKNKGKIKILDIPNSGAGGARNRGLDIATGEFLKFVDADDYLELNILEKMYKIAKEHNVSLVRGNFKTIIGPFHFFDTSNWGSIKETQLINVRENKDYIIKEMPGIGNKLISRKLWGDTKFPERQKWEDLAIIPMIMAKSEIIFHLDEPIYNYRVNMNTTITDFIKPISNILDIIRSLEILEHHLKEYNLDQLYQEQLKRLYILHTLFRIENALTWINFPLKKKEVVISSLINILDLKYPDWRENKIIEDYQNTNPLFYFSMTAINLFTKNYAPINDNEELENRIKKILKK